MIVVKKMMVVEMVRKQSAGGNTQQTGLKTAERKAMNMTSSLLTASHHLSQLHNQERKGCWSYDYDGETDNLTRDFTSTMSKNGQTVRELKPVERERERP